AVVHRRLMDDLSPLSALLEDLAGAVPAEALPVDALPVQAVFTLTWLTRLLMMLGQHAYVLGFLGALVENTVLLGFVLPGGTIVALSGAGARTAGGSLPLLILLGAAGMTGGAVIDYYIGRSGLTRLLRQRWMGRWGQHLEAQLNSAAPLLHRHGWWMMLVAHAFGHGRSALAVAAGMSHFSLRRLLAIEIPAALLWSSFYTGGGYLLAEHWDRLELALRRAGWAGIGVALLSGLSWWGLRWLQQRAQRQQPEAQHLPSSAAPVALPIQAHGHAHPELAQAAG
ncbi:MAG TPA: DedA family protein, partial [Chloroflexota bacterium]|nr:DedA family protein [Chloroflexota bacterium]